MSFGVALIELELDSREACPKESFFHEQQAVVGPGRASPYAPRATGPCLPLQEPPLGDAVPRRERIFARVECVQKGKAYRLAATGLLDEAAVDAPVQADIGAGRDGTLSKVRERPSSPATSGSSAAAPSWLAFPISARS